MRETPASNILKKKKQTERSKVRVKQEVQEEAEQEPDLVIDDTMETDEVKTEAREEQREEPAANTIKPPGVPFLQAQRDLRRPEQESESTSRDPDTRVLVDFADIALNHSKYSPEQRNSEESLPSPVEEDSATPLDLTNTPRVSAIRPSPPQVTTHIRPVPVTSVVTASGQPLRRLQPAAGGQTIQYIPVPVQTTGTAPPAPVMIQSNGGPVLLTNGSAAPGVLANGSTGPLQLTNGSPAPFLQANGSLRPSLLTNGSTGHVLTTNRITGPLVLTNGSPGPRQLTNGSPGHVSHVPRALIQLVQPPQRIRLTALPGGTTLLRTNMGRQQ